MPRTQKDMTRDLQRLVKRLLDDLRERSDSDSALRESLQTEYQAARESGRLGKSYSEWREGILSEAAVAWVLTGLFVRFLEDNGLLDEALLSGHGEAAEQARQRREDYFRRHPTHSDADYLLDAFQHVAQLPAMRELFDRQHNPIWRLPISGDAGRVYWDFWRKVVPETGELVYDFRNDDWDTRFLGDLYEELSEYAKKTFALCQTPEFVESFILDRTLDPAIETFGYREVRLIDPTCGSGHFLLGAFERLLHQWRQNAPGLDPRQQIRHALDAVYGVDINAFAVSIARFRLLIAALKAEGIKRLAKAPAYHFHLAAGDSLLHGRPLGELDLGHDGSQMQKVAEFGQCYAAEDHKALSEILGQQYHAVVGNPPYIQVKDPAVNQLYRQRYSSCHMKYSLGVPFTERFFQLALSSPDKPAGYVGMITTNSFMKREFGKKLIQEYLPQQDLSHVIDTSGAYIPGHGTPTVILFGRHRRPVSDKVRAVLGIRGEPSTPPDPANGEVWSSITSFVDQTGQQNDFVSSADLARSQLTAHPWSLQGGASPAVLAQIEEQYASRLHNHVTEIGFGAILGEDDAFMVEKTDPRRVAECEIRPLVEGDIVRDWAIAPVTEVLFPYDGDMQLVEEHAVGSALWQLRTLLWARPDFSRKSYKQVGRAYWEYHQIPTQRAKLPLSITFAFVATHNHFVLDRGGKVFNRSAPVIKLPEGATEEQHLELLGLLNSSTACFWMKQIFHNKGSTVDSHGARQITVEFENFYEYTGTGLQRFPLPEQRPSSLPATIDKLARERSSFLAAALSERFPLSDSDLESAQSQAASLLGQMIAYQEELDWWCYRAYGLLEDDLCFGGAPPEVQLGERAFEIVLARRMQAGEVESSWFRRHGSTPMTELPSHWPEAYRTLVQRRIDCIESNSWIELLERPEYKRRWNLDSWEELEQQALRDWLLDRLEDARYWAEPQLRSVRQLAQQAERDADFMQAAERYRGEAGFDVLRLVRELVEAESVPLLPVLRYKPSGLRKRAEWERTWALQRQEDAIDAAATAEIPRNPEESEKKYEERVGKEKATRKRKEVGDIPVPPKYKQADFLGNTFWRLRGGLDVPKERWFSLPHCSPEGDDSLLVGWAGWNALQRMQAVAGCYTQRRNEAGWEAEALKPLLWAMDELLPWVQQWHNDMDPDYGERMGDFFATFLQGQRHDLGLTREAVQSWQPPARQRGRPSAR